VGWGQWWGLGLKWLVLSPGKAKKGYRPKKTGKRVIKREWGGADASFFNLPCGVFNG
jgi:hypothetical protein